MPTMRAWINPLRCIPIDVPQPGDPPHAGRSPVARRPVRPDLTYSGSLGTATCPAGTCVPALPGGYGGYSNQCCTNVGCYAAGQTMYASVQVCNVLIRDPVYQQ